MILFLSKPWKEGSMAVNLSIKKVPDHIAERLRNRAMRHHRSLQGELLAVLEESVASERILSPSELLSAVRKSGLKTGEESAKLIRKERDVRSRR
jgi:plasmid stability protein